MKDAAPAKGVPAWKQFVVEHGWRATASDLAFVTGESIEEVLKFRAVGLCKPLAAANGFAELFALWNGREPLEEEWPAPKKYRDRRGYEWQAPELALLARLVGSFGTAADELVQTDVVEQTRHLVGIADAQGCQDQPAGDDQ